MLHCLRILIRQHSKLILIGGIIVVIISLLVFSVGAEPLGSVLFLIGIAAIIVAVRAIRKSKNISSDSIAPINGPTPESATDYDTMDGHEFEQYCAKLLKENGFSNVEVTSGSGDHGVDVLAERDGITYAVQCKRQSSNVGNKAVQEIFSGKDFYKRHIGVVFTNQYFTAAAKEAAERTGIVLWDRDKLNSMIEAKPIARDAHSVTETTHAKTSKLSKQVDSMIGRIVSQGRAARISKKDVLEIAAFIDDNGVDFPFPNELSNHMRENRNNVRTADILEVYIRYQKNLVMEQETLVKARKLRVKKVKIRTCEDVRVCDVCKKHANKIYNIDKAPQIPLCWECRCYYEPQV